MTPDDTTHDTTAAALMRAVVERRPAVGEPDVILSQRECVLFLVMSAREYAAEPCDNLNCEVCYDFVSCWQALYTTLDADYRAAVEEHLEYGDVRAPAHPSGLR